MRALVIGCLLLAAASSVLAQAPAAPRPAAPPGDLARGVGFGHADGGPVAAGRDYKVLLRADGFAFVPALGDRAPHNLPLDLAFAGAWRGATRLDDGRAAEPDVHADVKQVRWSRGPGLTELMDVRPEGLELSWQLDALPAGEGDLVIELQARTELPVLRHDEGGLWLGPQDLGGVRIGSVTGRDAAGREEPGALEWLPSPDGARLRLTLPDAFVRTAAWPVTLDPPLAPWTPFWNGTDWPPGQPRHDVVLGQPAGVEFLAVWVSDYSFADHDILGRATTYSELPILTDLLMLDVSAAKSDLPEMSTQYFIPWALLSWIEVQGGQQRVKGQLVHVDKNPALTVIGVPTDLSGLDASYSRPGVNISLSSSIEHSDGFVVYGSTSGLVRGVRVDSSMLGAGGHISIFSTKTLVSGVPNAQPTVSRHDNWGYWVLVAWRQPDGIHGLQVDIDGDAGPAKLLVPAGFPPIGPPRVDGVGTHMGVVETTDHPSAEFRVTLTYVDAAMNVSPQYVVTDHAVYEGQIACNLFSLNECLLVVATATATPPTNSRATTFTWATQQQGLQIAGAEWGAPGNVPVNTPGVNGADDDTLVGWVNAAGDVHLQAGTAWSPGGPIVPLGAGCGGAGTLHTEFEAALGDFTFLMEIDNATPSATVALLNLGPPQAPAICGPCSVKPLGLLLSFVKSGLIGKFYALLSIPTDPSLAGLSFEMQGLVKTPGAGGCAGLPNWSFTNRLVATIQ